MRASGWAAAGVLLAIAGCRTGPQPPGHGPAAVRGSLSTRYRARWTGHEDDHDLRELVTLQAGDAKKHAVTGFVLAEALADLDGDRGPGTFHSLADTYDGAVTARLYQAYADVHASRSLETIRLGRQTIVETPETTWFDGLRVETRELGERRFQLGAWGGVPVKLFASSTLGDSMLGAFAQTRPWRGGRIRADWMHVEDEGVFGPREDDLLGLEASQSLGSAVRVEAEHTRLADRARDLRMRASFVAPDSDLVLQASWYRLLETQKDLTVPFDPFYATLFELFPYEQVGLLGSKSLSRHFDLQAGFDVRRVEQDEDIGQFNRDFDRGFATVGIREVLPAQLCLALTGEVWDSQRSDLSTFGADLSRPLGAKAKAAVGTYYSLFKYDLFQDREIDRVRTWYAKFDWKRSPRTSLDLRYEFEDSDVDEYHSLRLGATWRF